MITPAEAEANSIGRASRNQTRLRIFSAIGIVLIFALAYLIQQQQRRLEYLINDQAAYTQRMCESRKVNTLKSNSNWEALAVIERRNKFIDEDIRQARLKVYENAKLVVPDCG